MGKTAKKSSTKGKLSSSLIKVGNKGKISITVDEKKQEKADILTKTTRKSLRKLRSTVGNEVLSDVSEVEIKKKGRIKVQKTAEKEDGVSDKNEIEETEEDKKMKSKKSSPYTVFVGNLPFAATPEEVRIHFEKAGTVKEIRLPTDKKTNRRRGFGYVQLKDRSSYEKALTLHHTHILGRKINVEYTTQGKKGGPKEEKIKQKNLKLRALSKIGILPSISGKKKVIKEKIKASDEAEGASKIQKTIGKKGKTKKSKPKKMF